MARLLISRRTRYILTIITIIAFGLLSGVQPAFSASNVNGYMTGYAFGNQTGASGNVIVQQDFANHPYSTCPNDPAAWWAWGSRIDVSSPSIYLKASNGNSYRQYVFYLEDDGDPTCSEGNYWADIYFGRFTPTPSSCNCTGSPSPGYCIKATPNNCTDAKNFSTHWSTYWGPY